jgi:hypothetical protein
VLSNSVWLLHILLMIYLWYVIMRWLLLIQMNNLFWTSRLGR